MNILVPYITCVRYENVLIYIILLLFADHIYRIYVLMIRYLTSNMECCILEGLVVMINTIQFVVMLFELILITIQFVVILFEHNLEYGHVDDNSVALYINYTYFVFFLYLLIDVGINIIILHQYYLTNLRYLCIQRIHDLDSWGIHIIFFVYKLIR